MIILAVIIGFIMGLKFGCTKYLRIVGLIVCILALIYGDTIIKMLPWNWLSDMYDGLSGGFGIAYLIGIVCSIADYFDNRMSGNKRAKANIIETIIRSFFH